MPARHTLSRNLFSSNRLYPLLLLSLLAPLIIQCGHEQEEIEPSKTIEIPPQSLSKKDMQRLQTWNLDILRDGALIYSNPIAFNWHVDTGLFMFPMERCQDFAFFWCQVSPEEDTSLLHIAVSGHHISPEQGETFCTGEGDCGELKTYAWYDRDLFTLASPETTLISSLDLCEGGHPQETLQATITRERFAPYPAPLEAWQLDLQFLCPGEERHHLSLRFRPGEPRR